MGKVGRHALSLALAGQLICTFFMLLQLHYSRFLDREGELGRCGGGYIEFILLWLVC